MECCVPALKVKDLIAIKTAGNLSFANKLLYTLKIFYTNINFIPPAFETYFETFQHFINYLSYYEIEAIAYTYTLTTFDSPDLDSYEKIITCPKCSNKIRQDIYLSEFASLENIKIWDKVKPYYEYIFNYTYNKNGITINIDFYIPNILTFTQKIRGINEQTIEHNIKKYNDILDPVTILTLHTKKIIIENQSNNTKENVELLFSNDIYDFYSNLPAYIYDDILTYFHKNIYIYKPRYKLKITCNNCNTTFSIKLSPLLEFISILDNNTQKNKIGDILNSYLKMYETLLIVTNNNYQFNNFIELPFPVYLQLIKDLQKRYEQKINKLKQQKIFLPNLDI